MAWSFKVFGSVAGDGEVRVFAVLGAEPKAVIAGLEDMERAAAAAFARFGPLFLSSSLTSSLVSFHGGGKFLLSGTKWVLVNPC